MATFYLKEPDAKDTLIILVYNFNRNRFKYSTGQKIKPGEWNETTHRARKGAEGGATLNRLLDKLDRAVTDIHRELLADDIPVTPAILKERLNKIMQKEEKKRETFIQFAERYIKECKQKQTSKTIFNTVLGHLKDYPGAKDFKDINAAWMENYTAYLEKKNFAANYIGKNISTIKQFLNEAGEQKVSNNIDYKSTRFKRPSEEAMTIYLTADELTKLKKAELSPAQDRIRDLFLIGAFTALRYSDFSKLSLANIEGDLLRIRTQKTNQQVVIPLHPIIKEIIQKYGGALPRPISNQKMNKALKEIAKEAGLKDKVVKAITKGGKLNKTEFFKYQLVTSHTARRSAASNMFLAGIPALSIMKITGHTTEKSFMKYIKITGEQNARMLSNHPFFQEKQVDAPNP